MNFATLLLSSVASLIQVFYQQDVAQDQQQTFFSQSSSINVENYFIPSTRTNQIFDFIVVGGGSAGSIVAKRLAEDGRFSVALLEIGGDPAPVTNVPAFALSYRSDEYITFQYPATIDSSGRATVLTQGKVLGGTGILNSMNFNRGSPYDYDHWANYTGDDSWKYSNILPYFKNMETYKGRFPSEEHHGSDGPITISNDGDVTGMLTFFDAGAELGFPMLDSNGPQKIGFSPFEVNKRNGRRDSSYAAYIGQKDAVANLTVITFANVTQITFDESNRATGVVYYKHGVTFIARATREVVVCAGTFGSPQLLIRSGVGPADHLAELNIPLVSNVPTGQNLQDHTYAPLKFTLEDRTHVYNPLLNITESSAEEYLEFGTGPLIIDSGINGQAFIASSEAAAEGFSDWADFQLVSFSHHLDVYPFLSEDGDEENAIYICPEVGRVKSRGSVKLNSDNIYFEPIINFNLLSDEQGRDRQVLREAINITIKLFEKTQAYQDIGAKFPKPNLPDCDQFEYRSVEYWDCYIDHVVNARFHTVGTCAMGPSDDPKSVVDSKLRVIGVSGLRVMDASVMPTICNANPQAPVFLIAEKGSADILADHK